MRPGTPASSGRKQSHGVQGTALYGDYEGKKGSCDHGGSGDGGEILKYHETRGTEMQSWNVTAPCRCWTGVALHTELAA